MYSMLAIALRRMFLIVVSRTGLLIMLMRQEVSSHAVRKREIQIYILILALTFTIGIMERKSARRF